MATCSIGTAQARHLVAWNRVLFGALALWVLGLVSACSGVKLVADYDAEAAKAITETSSEVFAFYDSLIEARASGPVRYSAFSERWGKIETRLRVLKVREDARPINNESQRIAQTILEFWDKYRKKHQSTNDYAAVLLPIHRDRFQRLFTAALVAERAKRLADPDADPKLDKD